MGNSPFKTTSYENRGDTLEAKLRDIYGNYYFKGKALVTSKKQMKELLDNLKKKGVNLPSGWFD